MPAIDIPSVEMDKKVENEIAVMLGQLRLLGNLSLYKEFL